MGKLSELKLSLLKAPLKRSRIKTRKQGKSEVDYLEGHDIINTANEIFGYDGWTYEPIGEIKTEKVGEGYLSKARVKIGIKLDDGTFLYRTDVGYNVPAVKKDYDTKELLPPTPANFDTAEKGALTDAMKRAFRSFGNQFGNSLYDRSNKLGDTIKKCPSCGGTMRYKVGYSKKQGKMYSVFVCDNETTKKCDPLDLTYYEKE
jgi:DNA repair and recombination protein RAD52